MPTLLQPNPETIFGLRPDPHALRIDYLAGTDAIYVGAAEPGALTTAPVWQIQKLTWDANHNLTAAEWAHGNAFFGNVWDDRAALPYS